MTEKAALIKARVVDQNHLVYRTGTLIRDANPFSPTGLLWLLPLEPQRARELKSERGRGFIGIKDSRVPSLVCSVGLFFTTLLITVSSAYEGTDLFCKRKLTWGLTSLSQVLPTILWVVIYFIFTLPLRLFLTVELVTSTLNITSPNITAFITWIRSCFCGYNPTQGAPLGPCSPP
jgi:hypothetical protein